MGLEITKCRNDFKLQYKAHATIVTPDSDSSQMIDSNFNYAFIIIIIIVDLLQQLLPLSLID